MKDKGIVISEKDSRPRTRLTERSVSNQRNITNIGNVCIDFSGGQQQNVFVSLLFDISIGMFGDCASQ